MAHTNLNHRRTHNLLLISRLLNQRDGASPFTLVLDTLEQPARPLIREYLRRAALSKTHTIFLAFETVKPPVGVETFISCYNKTHLQISQAVSSTIQANSTRRNLIFIDSLHPLCNLSLNARTPLNLTAYLSSFLAPQPTIPHTQTSLVAVYHTDISLPIPAHLSYQPSALSLLSYLATTILRIHSLSILLAVKEAQDRSLPAPSFGLSEERQGILIGLKPARSSRGTIMKPEERGIVLELEHRRKSGRGVREWYFLPQSLPQLKASPQSVPKETVTLLDDHPLFKRTKEPETMSEQELTGMTFELGLTDRQKLERDGVVLPYFDAQKEGGLGGPGEGGRILYDMGSEDDFDEEEDEI